MRLEDMSTNQKTVLFVVLSGAWVGFLWYFYLYGAESSQEQIAASRMRRAKSVSVQARLQNGDSELEALTGDREGLVRAFRVVSPRAETYPGMSVSVPIYDVDDAANPIIMWLFPPDIANLDGRLYKVDPAFWAAVLERAPKTNEWLKTNLSKGKGGAPRGGGRPRRPAAKQPPAGA